VLAKELQGQNRSGNPDEEGITWPRSTIPHTTGEIEIFHQSVLYSFPFENDTSVS
jgi:hypothetical protein